MVVSANYLGSPEPQGAIKVQAEKTAAAITKGDLLNISSGKWQTAATGGSGPFAVALETKAASAATVSILREGIVYVTSDGVITPNDPVTVSGSTAGQVISNVTPTLANQVGIYLGHENEGDGSTVPTAAADGDVIRIHFRSGL